MNLSIIALALTLLMSILHGWAEHGVQFFKTAATEMRQPALLSQDDASESEMETPAMSEIDKVLTNISQVAVRRQGGAPAKVSLDIQGEHPDGCDLPVLVEQSRRGAAIQVTIYREVPADVFCPMILRPYSGTVELDGTLAAGVYTLAVNAHSQEFEI